MSQTEPSRLRKGHFYTSPFSLHLPSHEETAAMPRAAHRRAVGTTLLLLGEELKPALVPGLWTPVALCRFPTCVHKKDPKRPSTLQTQLGRDLQQHKIAGHAHRGARPPRLSHCRTPLDTRVASSRYAPQPRDTSEEAVCSPAPPPDGGCPGP